MEKNSKNEVIIVGASFAGLATANFIEEGKTLILERQKELGKNQKSTCCTSVEWIERLNCRDSILKTFDSLTLHSSDGHRSTVKLPKSFCTIDYKRFCTILSGNLENTEILTGSKVVGVKNNLSPTVLTRNGSFTGKVVVDCSGWKGVSNNGSRQKGAGRLRPAFGIEVETEFDGDTDSFHIYYGKKFIQKGYGWIFPTGKDTARIGLGGYSGFKPREALKGFLRTLNIEANGRRAHGGFLPTLGLGKPVNGRFFMVGDASWQVLPLSGEGIRKTFEYAQFCGKIINSVLRDELTLDEGLKIYRDEVFKAKGFYGNMLFTQTLAIHCPDWGRNRIIRTLSRVDESRLESLLVRYFNDEITSSKARILKTVLGGILG